MQNEQQIKDLVGLLSDENELIRSEAVDDLVLFGESVILPLFYRYALGTDDDIDELYAVDKPPQPIHVYLSIIEVFRRLGSLTTPILVNFLINGEYSTVREAAADFLGYVGDERAITPLIQALKDKVVVESVIEALRKFDDPRIIKAFRSRGLHLA